MYFVNELNRRQSEGDEEVRILKEELDKERKKSMADEATIRKLENIIKDKQRVHDENKRI